MSEPVISSGSAGSSVVRPIEGGSGLRAHRGPETVINPERRLGGPLAPSLPAGGGSPLNSKVARALFPPEENGGMVACDAESGVQLGHFSIIERIRSGGMGAVFRAIDTRLNRVVALKVLPPTLSRDPLIVQRFKNEAQSAAQLDHENIARVFYIGEEQGLHFIAFEYIVGTNVRELIQQQGRLPVSDAVNFALQIASALVHTSAQGVVHRDIKPSNIIITPSGRAKLVDLGLARKENRDEEAADLTMAGTTLGTFDYISPEQARDPRTADVRSDVYSLGCTLYHMLTGAPPYPEGTVLQKLLQHQGDDAPDPAKKNAAVPEDLSIVVRKMMAKDPRRRYQNAEQLVRDMMLVAGAMGLRSVSPEGLVWLSAGGKRPTFFERHLAWMATAAALLLIVGYLEYGSHGNASRIPQAPPTASGRPPEAAIPESGMTTPGESASDDERPSRQSSTSTGLLKQGARPVVVGAAVSDGTNRPAENRDDPPKGDENSVPLVVNPIPLSDVGRNAWEGSYARGPQVEPSATSSRSPSGAFPFKGPGRGSRSMIESESTPDDDEPPAVARKPPGSSPPNANGGARAGAVERTAEVDYPPPIPSEDDGIFLLSRDGGLDHKYASLEAACSAIRNDGAVIELRFDGKRTETSLKITRKVTIRAAKGRRPVIEFHPRLVVTDGSQVRALSLPSGLLHLVGVELVMHVEEGVSADQWTLFSVERPDSLRLEGVIVTMVNPRMYPAAIVELRAGAGSMMPPDMPIVGGQPRPPLEIEMSDCLFRGQCDLILVRHAEPGRLAIRHSVAAVQGALLASRGSTETPPENAQLELKLEHVTAALGGGLIRMDSGNLPRKLSPVQVFAFDSIFSNASGSHGLDPAPLVAMTGNSPPQDFRKLLMWNGRSNIYDRFQSFWSVVSTEGTGRSENWDFATWRSNWTDAAEANARAVDDGIWRRQWTGKAFVNLAAADFALDRQGRNPAVSGATNTNDAGAELVRIPRPSVSTVGDAAAERRRD